MLTPDLFELTRPLVEYAKLAGMKWPPQDKGTFTRIRFKDGRWADKELIIDEMGAITTYEMMAAWECSLAHMKPDGRIARFHELIGHRDSDVWIWNPLQLEDRK